MKPRLGLAGEITGLTASCQLVLQPFAEVHVLNEPVSAVGTSSFDLVLLFLEDPYLEGVRLFAQYRTRQPALPVILLGTGLDANHATELLKWGAADYLDVSPARPLDYEALWRKVERVLGRRMQLTLDSALLEPLLGVQSEEMTDQGANRRRCFRVGSTPKHPASVIVRLTGAGRDNGSAGEVSLPVVDLSLSMEGRGGMRLRVEGPCASRLPNALRKAGAKFRAWAQLKTEPALTEVDIEVMRVEESPSAAHGRILWLGVQYAAVDARQEDRFRRYWMQCQRDRTAAD